MLLIFVMISSILAAGGCTTLTGTENDNSKNIDPIVGVWKQELWGLVATMEFYDNGTGIMTSDTSAIAPDSPSSPAITRSEFKWTRISDTEYNIVKGSVEGIFIYDKATNCLYDSDSTRSRLKLYKQ